MDEVPERSQAKVKEAVNAAYRAPSLPLARVIRDEVVARYEKRYPAAMRSFLQGLRGLCGSPALAPSPSAGLSYHQPA